MGEISQTSIGAEIDASARWITDIVSKEMRSPRFIQMLETHFGHIGKQAALVQSFGRSVARFAAPAVKIAQSIDGDKLEGSTVFIEHLKNQLKEEINLQLGNARQEVEQARQELAAVQRKIISLHNSIQYPRGIPEGTVLVSCDGAGVPEGSGVYFLWRHGVIEYVGISKNLQSRLRLGVHHAMEDGDFVSWILFPARELLFAESYYIGVLRPTRNFGNKKLNY